MSDKVQIVSLTYISTVWGCIRGLAILRSSSILEEWKLKTSLESSCALLLESAKNCKFAKMFAKKIVQKLKNYTFFEKPLTMPFQICKKFCKIKKNLIFNQEKLKMCKFPLTDCLQKICNFFRKTCAICFLLSKAFQKAKFYQNLTSGSGSKQRFSLSQEKTDMKRNS